MLLKKYRIFYREKVILVRAKLNWSKLNRSSDNGIFCKSVVNCVYSSEDNKCRYIGIKNGKSLFSVCREAGMDNQDINKFTYIPHQTKYYVRKEI